tara:strand:- start:205 stop:426 length:222 start_codon:yes stop_codon:yes gene_type:complete
MKCGGLDMPKFFVNDIWTASRLYEVEAATEDEAMQIVEDQADFDVDAEQSGANFQEIRRKRQHLDRFQQVENF